MVKICQKMKKSLIRHYVNVFQKKFQGLFFSRKRLYSIFFPAPLSSFVSPQALKVIYEPKYYLVKLFDKPPVFLFLIIIYLVCLLLPYIRICRYSAFFEQFIMHSSALLCFWHLAYGMSWTILCIRA